MLLFLSSPGVAVVEVAATSPRSFSLLAATSPSTVRSYGRLLIQLCFRSSLFVALVAVLRLPPVSAASVAICSVVVVAAVAAAAVVPVVVAAAATRLSVAVSSFDLAYPMRPS